MPHINNKCIGVPIPRLQAEKFFLELIVTHKQLTIEPVVTKHSTLQLSQQIITARDYTWTN